MPGNWLRPVRNASGAPSGGQATVLRPVRARFMVVGRSPGPDPVLVRRSGGGFGGSGLIGQIVDQTAGYPYFLQFFGAFTCGRIGLEHIELADFQRIEPALLHELDLAFFEDRFLTASNAEQDLLLRMASSSGDRLTAADLRVALRDVPNINELLRRLVTRGLLYRPTRGSYRFALPLFGRYLRRHRKITKITESVTFPGARSSTPRSHPR